jgi:hypothetical protein
MSTIYPFKAMAGQMLFPDFKKLDVEKVSSELEELSAERLRS